MNQIDRRIAELSPAKRALLERKLQQKAKQFQPETTIPRLVNRESIPLSFAQSRLWCLDRLEPGNLAYNRTVKINLDGNLNPTILEESLNEIARRHEILRTSFPAIGEQPIQAIAPQLLFHLPWLDLTDLPKIELEKQLDELAIAEARQTFDLSRLPLIRATLFKIEQEKYMLLVTTHHIIFDGWSDNVFVQELGAIYTALAAGSPSPLPELPIQYADFANWQQTWQEGKEWASQFNYWKEQLSGTPSTLQLPTIRDRWLVRDSQSDRQELKLSPRFSQALKNWCQQEKTTLFIALLTAFNVLLYRYTQQEDIIICSPVAGRSRIEVEKLIGYFNNLLPLRSDLSGNPSFRDLLTRIRQVVVGAYEHQDIPFQNIAELPNLVRTPLAIGMFALQNSTTEFLELPEIQISSVNLPSETADFDLAWSMQEIKDAIAGVIEYRTGLFDPATITSMAENFEIVLQSMVNNPDLPISSVPYFGKAENTHSVESASFVAPSTELEMRLGHIWENILEIAPISLKDDFFALGGHSLLAVRLFAAIERDFGKKLPIGTLLKAPTIDKLARVLSSSEISILRNSLVPIKPGNSQPPLFFIHDANGETILYRQLAFALNSDRLVYGLQPYSKDGFPMLHTRIGDMVTHYIETIRSVQPKGPYLLSGLCIGGILAFEVALQLQARGEKVAFVGLIDAVDVEAPRTTQIAARRLDRLAQVFRDKKHSNPLKRANYVIQTVANKARNVVAYELSSRLERWRNEAKILLLRYYSDNGLPLPNFLRDISTRKVYYFAQKEYIPQGLFEGDLSLFLATEGEGKELPAIKRTDANLCGWDRRVAKQIKVYDIMGNHSNILQEPKVKVMGVKMENDIKIALSNYENSRSLFLEKID
jgi:thioesterase domain-containing protein/acyl carrier protein